jgi:hypothetical protein
MKDNCQVELRLASHAEEERPVVLLISLWAVLLIVFMVVRPAPYSPAFWILLGAATLFGGLYMRTSYRESRRTQRATTDWLTQVHALVDVDDFEDDGHLPEFLDGEERRRVIEELQRMPAGSRSLRRALATVSPEIVADEDGPGPT